MTPFVREIKKHNEFGKKLIGLEVGVRGGTNAIWILDSLEMEKMFLVDSYLPYSDMPRFIEQNEQDGYYKEIIKKISDRKEKIILIRESSEKARSFFEKDYFDFIYIDADHSYQAITDDLKWYDYVKKGGIIGGHDFQSGGGYGVEQVVKEFAKEINKEVLKLDVRLDGGVEWAIIKN